MTENIIAQIIVGLFTVIAAVLSVVLVLAKKLNNVPQSNGQKRIDNGIQRQMDAGDDTTSSLSTRFDSQVNICNQRWLKSAESDGRIDAYMVEIRDRLTKIENKKV
jgi:hypothetical protein